MSTLDLRNAKRLFYGSVEAKQLYYGGQLLWTKPQAGSSSLLLLNRSPDGQVGFNLSNVSATGMTLQGTTTRNHITWNIGVIPAGYAVRMTITKSNSVRLMIRSGATADILAGAYNYYDSPSSGTIQLNSTTHSTDSTFVFFGFLTTATGTFTVSNFEIVPS